MTSAGTKTPVEQSMIQRATGALKYLITGVAPDGWMGPGQPLAPLAQEQAKGRAMDYMVGRNMRTNPRQGEGNPFSVLRDFADMCPVLRTVIETRKDQLCRLDWQIVPREEDSEKGTDAKDIETFLQAPDKEHTWDQWLRMLLEDLFVIDAPVIYPRRTKGGGLYALEPMDGATINRLLDDTGRTPLPPSPAYQQILKGVPASDYTAAELIYMPRNLRTHRAYGYGPVEQILMIVNIALRRDVHKLQYYTDGSTPDLIWATPDSWNPDQIKQFQELWDSMMAGNTANRRKGLFVPSGVKPIDTKEAALKDEFDEWLARVICFCFSIPPQPFIKEVNRATADTAKTSAAEEGLAPLKKWVKNLLDRVLAQYFDAPHLEFSWQAQEDVDPLVQAQIHQIYKNIGVLDVNEVRKDIGRAELTPEQIEARKPALPVGPQDGQDGEGGDGGDNEPPKGGKAVKDGETQKLAKSDTEAKAIKPVPFDRPDVKRERKALAGALTDFLSGESEAAAADVQNAYETRLSKVAEADDLITALIEAIDWGRWDQIIVIVQPHIEVVGDSTGLRALITLPLDKTEIEAATPAVEDAAVTYARNRAAEMVGQKYNSTGELAPNANARWAITDSTREALRAEIEKNLAAGADPRALAQAIRESTQFDKARATLIARTELIMAHNAANLASYKAAAATGLDIKKRWVTAHDDRVSPDCVLNEVAGELELDSPFPSGGQAPPCHPNCRCDIAPMVK